MESDSWEGSSALHWWLGWGLMALLCGQGGLSQDRMRAHSVVNIETVVM